MKSFDRVSRRAVLRGAGVAVALPWLEAMVPAIGRAGSLLGAGPKRVAFLYVPNGVHMPDWTPSATGAGFDLPFALEPLRAVRDDLLVLSGLTLDPARAHGDGGGDHARSMAAFLTGRHPRKTGGTDLRAGVSVDQLIASKVGRSTRFASLELGCEGSRDAGQCDHGYSCAYQVNLSWRGERTPAAKEVNPRLVFDRLFGTGAMGTTSAAARRERRQRGLLDFVADDTRRLSSKLGTADRRKLDEYITAIREIERRIDATQPSVDLSRSSLARPSGIPSDYREHLRLMADLLAIAFQADLTRVATLVFANDGSNRSYRDIGVPEGHHDLSHHGGDARSFEKLRAINRFHVEQLAYLVGRLKSIPEGDGTLLDQSMIIYGSGISDGNAHSHHDLPILVAGRGGGRLKTGRHLRFPRETPLTNLYLSVLSHLGIDETTFGDSTGPLSTLLEA